MKRAQIPPSGKGPVSREARVDLVGVVETLREEIAALKEENAELQKRLAEAKATSTADREQRRAALNLMEDAIVARQVAQRESAGRQRVEEELRAADLRKDEFLAMLAHELRNPLAPIRNGMFVLRSAAGDPEVSLQMHEMIERQVTHLVRLVDDLLEVSRITRGIVEIRTEEVDVRAIIAAATEASGPLIHTFDHSLEVSVPDVPAMIEADPVRMTQVVTNLLNNAAKYTRPGGKIRLTVVANETDVRVSVRDNGIGVPVDKLSQVFEPFIQLDRSIARSQGGLGIGLTLVRALTNRHGGTVECRSEGPGTGSEFIVTLPLIHTAAHGVN